MEQDTTVYGRIIEDGGIDYPVSMQHILNRGEPPEWYQIVQFEPKPTIPPFYTLAEIVTAIKGQIIVSYAPVPISLEVLMRQLPGQPEDPFAPPTTPEDVEPPSAELIGRIKALVVERVQTSLDAFAATRGYGDAKTSPMVAACSYAASTHVRYGPEGRYCLAQRENTWDMLYYLMADVEAGKVPMPVTFKEIAALLPVLEWPTAPVETTPEPEPVPEA